MRRSSFLAAHCRNRSERLCRGRSRSSYLSFPRSVEAGRSRNLSGSFRTQKFQALAENYRSTQKILDCAYSIIRHNPEIEGNEHTLHLNFQRHALHSPVFNRASTRTQRFRDLFPVRSLEEEADDIVETILRERQRANVPWSAFAVLYRSHYHREPLMQRLAAHSIPFTRTEGTDIFQTEPVRECMALLRCLDVREHGIALFRAALMPRFSIDAAELQHRFGCGSRDLTVKQVLVTVAGGDRFIAELTRAKEELLPLIRSTSDVLAVGLHPAVRP